MSLNETAGHVTPPSGVIENTVRNLGADLNPIIASMRRLQCILGPWGTTIIVIGLTVACGGAFWSLQEGAPLPLVLMGAYSIVMSTIAVTALFVSKAQAKADESGLTLHTHTLAAWKLVSVLSVSDASRLWCNIEPGAPYSRDSMAWATAMLDAIKSGELPVKGKSDSRNDLDDRERTNPTWHTKVTRDALKSWAKAHGHCPAFLRS